MKTLKDLVLEASKKYSSKIAVEEGSNSISFKKIYSESLKVSKFLTDNGLKKGDRVSICMSKSVNQILSIIGTSPCRWYICSDTTKSKTRWLKLYFET